jgi:PAS domain S-box-containing protein
MDLASFQRELEAFCRRHDELVEIGPLDVEPSELLDRMTSMMEGLLAMSAEVSSQRAALLHSEEALAVERARYEELWNAIPFGLVDTNPQGVIVRANDVAAHLLGMRAERLVKKPLTLFVAEEDRADFRHRLLAIAESAGSAHWDTRMVAATSSCFHASVWADVLKSDPAANEIRWTVLDVTEDRQHERELAAANRELERRLSEQALRHDERPRADRARRAS